MDSGDAYGNSEFDRVPHGPFAGRPWRDVPALTLHNILNAVEFGLMELDERRVVAIRAGLRAKDGASGKCSAVAKAMADRRVSSGK